MPTNVYELSENAQPLRGRIQLQVAEKCPLNMVEIEVIGIEETKWSTAKKNAKGEYAFLNEKTQVFVFPDQKEEGGGISG